MSFSRQNFMLGIISCLFLLILVGIYLQDSELEGKIQHKTPSELQKLKERIFLAQKRHLKQWSRQMGMSNLSDKQNLLAKSSNLPLCDDIFRQKIYNSGKNDLTFLEELKYQKNKKLYFADEINYPYQVIKNCYLPKYCQPRNMVYLIVPFRNRYQHKQRFEDYMFDFLRLDSWQC